MAAHSIDARVGRGLRNLRLRAGLDIEGLARRSGIQPARIALYEAGRERVPAEVLLQLSRLLGAGPGDVFA